MEPTDYASLEPTPDGEGPRLVLLRDLVEELSIDADAAHVALTTGQPRGPQIGLPGVDEALGGFLCRGLHLLQAAPGTGKSALCLQVAVDCGFPGLYVTAEMPPLELFRRVIARTTRTYLGQLKSGALPAAEVAARALRAIAAAPKLAILDATTAFASVNAIRTAAELLRERFNAQRLLLVLDSLQVWARGFPGQGSEYELVTEGVKGACRLASALACPVLAISHRNRVGQKEGGLHAGKGSGDLEYAAETVLELTPGPDARPGSDAKPVVLAIHKNRHGDAGCEVALEFEGRLQQFREA